MTRIGVFCHVGNRNLGDEAAFATVIRAIRRRRPDIHLLGFTANPQDTTRRHGIDACQIRRHIPVGPRPATRSTSSDADNTGSSTRWARAVSLIKRSRLLYAIAKTTQSLLNLPAEATAEVAFLSRAYRAMRSVDLLIVAGSQQLIDFIDGPWNFPFMHFKWSLLARACGTRVAFLGVGAGPIESPVSRLLVRNVLSHAVYRSFRDEGSKQLAEEIGVRGKNLVGPDLVFGMASRAVPEDSNPRSPRVVGINPVPFRDSNSWPGSSPELYVQYVRILAEFAGWLTEKGFRVVLFPTQLNLDPPVIRDICDQIAGLECAHMDRVVTDLPIQSVEDLTSTILEMDIVVATRFHGIVFPLRLGKPTLGIAYHRKTNLLMTQFGQSEFVVDIASMTLAELQERFIRLEARADAIGKEVRRRVAACQPLLEDQYDDLFAALQSGERGSGTPHALRHL